MGLSHCRYPDLGPDAQRTWDEQTVCSSNQAVVSLRSEMCLAVERCPLLATLHPTHPWKAVSSCFVGDTHEKEKSPPILLHELMAENG